MKERLQAQGAIPSGNTPAEFARLIDQETRQVGAGGEGLRARRWTEDLQPSQITVLRAPTQVS
jgi:hypothetical protein